MTRWLRRIGTACADHPLRTIAVWLLLAGTVTTLGFTVGGRFSDDRALPGTEVAVADDRLTAHFPSAADESATVLLHARSARQLDAALPRVQAAIRRLPHVVGASTDTVTRSRDGRTGLIAVQYDVPRFTLHGRDLTALRTAARASGVPGYVTGSLFYDLDNPSSGLGEKVGIGVAILVLLVAFGSVIAALMPVATAAFAILTGLGLVHLLASVYDVNGSAPALATMLGLGAGIDYALFIVTRHRENMRLGLSAADAAAAATARAGSSVLWAGVTVVAAICGLAFAGIPIITSLGFASAIVVAVSVISALTLLPALLSLTDEHIDYLHIPMPHLRHERVGAALDPATAPPTGWARWARAIERRPLRYALASVAALAVLAIPVAGMRLGMPDAAAAPAGSAARVAYGLQSAAFGVGSTAPLRAVVAMPTAANVAAVGRTVRAVLRADRDVASVSPMLLSPDRTTGVLTVVERSSPQGAATSALVERLRRDEAVIRRATGARMWVTGMPAGRFDVAQRVLDRLPYFVAAVLAVSFLLLGLVFRSLLVPLKAVLLNLLSISAALGVVVAVFTWGWLRQVVGVSTTVPVVDVIPMLLFAIVFGLSMDYEVFLLSRVREEWVLGGDSRGSVVRGLTSTARVISAAAGIMVAVFLAFTLSSDVVVKMMGVGLAIAVLLDATLIRLVLVPATMALLGDLNWWLPRWLDRLLPHVDIDAAVPVTPALGDDALRQPTEVPMPRPTA